ncbi:hypothetical protein GCM10028868_34900 [Virgibacillus kimchii]
MKIVMLISTAFVIINALIVSKASADPDTAPPSLSSEAAIMMEENTGTVIYEKNASTQMYPASLTKMATAIYAIETGDLDEDVTVSSNAVNVKGTTVFLEEGETIPLIKLI